MAESFLVLMFLKDVLRWWGKTRRCLSLLRTVEFIKVAVAYNFNILGRYIYIRGPPVVSTSVEIPSPGEHILTTIFQEHKFHACVTICLICALFRQIGMRL